MQNWLDKLDALIPAGAAAIVGILAFLALNLLIKRRAKDSKNRDSISYQVLRLLLVAFTLIVVILLAPIGEKAQGQVLSLLGLVFTAIIALSSTTFVSNVMAGLMLQAANTIRPGDFIRVNDQFGRVTRRNLLQTQIQTEWRDLTTLPNILLINNPVTVLHRDGTIISAEISLGYDIPYTQVEELLGLAASEAGLEEPFVLTQDLLDHAVAYRVAGFLPDMRNLLTARSNLRKKAIEVLHGHGIEIASPTLMNTRPMDPERKIIPDHPVRHQRDRPTAPSAAPEERIFDKAVEAADLEQLHSELERVGQELKQLRDQARNASEEQLAAHNARIERARERETWLQALIEERTEPGTGET